MRWPGEVHVSWEVEGRAIQTFLFFPCVAPIANLRHRGETGANSFEEELRKSLTWRNGMLKIAVVTGSTRPGRNNETVARWVWNVAKQRNDAEFELVDIASYNLPLLDEPTPALYGQYSHEHTKVWSNKIASFDAFVFVTPEYNHSTSGALKNAVDYLYREWNNKAAGFVSYGGSSGGACAVEHLRLITAALRIATVPAQVLLSLFTDFENFKTLKPGPQREKELSIMLDQLVAWGAALKTLRFEAEVAVASK
jgi:NAD(P)H-dependent FMN reductase